MNSLSNVADKLQKQMLAELLMADPIGHRGLKGTACEDVWIAWMGKYLPSRYSITRGQVVDYKGNMSEQIDIIIHDRIFSSPLLVNDAPLLVPAESVYAIFESKSDLSSKNIRYAQNKAESVRLLKRTNANIRHIGGQARTENKPILAGILTKKSTIRDYEKEILNYNPIEMNQNLRLDLGCSANGRGFIIDEEKLEFLPTENTLVNFLYRLLTILQIQGSVAAIEYDKYLNTINESQ